MNAKETWDFIRAQRILGPWEEYWTEEQRVQTMMVRRLPDYEGTIGTMAYGPVQHIMPKEHGNERRWWFVSFGPSSQNPISATGLAYLYLPPGSKYYESLDVAKKVADEALVKTGWTLVD